MRAGADVGAVGARPCLVSASSSRARSSGLMKASACSDAKDARACSSRSSAASTSGLDIAANPPSAREPASKENEAEESVAGRNE